MKNLILGNREKIIYESRILSQKVSLKELASRFRVPIKEVLNMEQRVKFKVGKAKNISVFCNVDEIRVGKPLPVKKFLEMAGFPAGTHIFEILKGMEIRLTANDMVIPGHRYYTITNYFRE